MLESAGMVAKDDSGENSSSSSSRHRQASFAHSAVHRAAPVLLETPHQHSAAFTCNVAVLAVQQMHAACL
jgi:hypothetical protein